MMSYYFIIKRNNNNNIFIIFVKVKLYKSIENTLICCFVRLCDLLSKSGNLYVYMYFLM